MLEVIYNFYMAYAMPVFFISWIIKVVAEFTNFKTLEKTGRAAMWLSAPVFIFKIFEMLDAMMNAY